MQKNQTERIKNHLVYQDDHMNPIQTHYNQQKLKVIVHPIVIMAAAEI